MKRILFTWVITCLAVAGLWAQPSAGTSNAKPTSNTHPFFYITKDIVDLGAIARNKLVEVEFEFENTGKMPLVIKSVRKSCGCTEVTWPREPVMPGKTATINATYDASDSGVFNKKLTVLANTEEGMHVLSIRGSIKE